MLDYIHIFNQSNLRYSWPVLLSKKLNYFFQGLDIQGELEDKPMVEMENRDEMVTSGNITHLRDLIRAPDRFRILGEPAIPGKAQRSRYLSGRYLQACNEPLETLGIKEMDRRRLCRDLVSFVSKNHDG